MDWISVADDDVADYDNAGYEYDYWESISRIHLLAHGWIGSVNGLCWQSKITRILVPRGTTGRNHDDDDDDDEDVDDDDDDDDGDGD